MANDDLIRDNDSPEMSADEFRALYSSVFSIEVGDA
jgi:hypothetical protein